MFTALITAQGIYNARTPEELAVKQAQMLRKKRAAGIPVDMHYDAHPMLASVNHGRWVIECSCGSGVGVHPEWPEARCFGCGAIYLRIVFPIKRLEIERELASHPLPEQRNWRAEIEKVEG